MSVTITDALQAKLQSYKNELHFRLNGEDVTIHNPDPTTTLVNYLHDQGLVGTKVGCEQGGCGACTVMLSKPCENGTDIDHRSINSCLRPLVAVGDMEVTTVEGIGNLHDGLDRVQHKIALYNGTQCGFCTPGFVMNMHAYLQQHETPTEQQIEDIFGGNLCRCTGYRPILHGMRTFACDYKSGEDTTEPCTLDPFFELKVRDQPIKIDGTKLTSPHALEVLHFAKHGIHYIRPTTLEELQELQDLIIEHEGKNKIKLIVGNTASGIYPDLNKVRFAIDISRIKELTHIHNGEQAIELGAAVPIQDLIEFAEKLIKEKSPEATRGLRQFTEHAKHIAGIQVRNAGSVAGNIFITKSNSKSGHPFPSDLFTVLSALGTTVTIRSKTYLDGTQTCALQDMPIAEDLPPDALLLSFRIPFTRKGEFVHTYRIARRPQMAHPIVNAGFRCLLDENNTIKEMSLIYGGLTNCNGRLAQTEKWLIGKTWDDSMLADALTQLKKEVGHNIVSMDEEGFTNEYRAKLAESFFYKFFLYVGKQTNPTKVDEKNYSAADQTIRPLSTGLQTFEIDDMMLPLTSPIVKRTAVSQATGEVRYCHDLPLPPGGYYAEIVTSTEAHARFEFSEDRDKLEERLKKKFKGFARLITVEDIPEGGKNIIGLGGDDPIFADGEVFCIGSAICLVLADDKVVARHAAEYVRHECIKYEKLPAVVSFEEAIEKKLVLPLGPGKKPDVTKKVLEVIRHGSDKNWVENPTQPLDGGTLVSGTMRTHAQEHFYMETMCAMAVPGSYDEMTVFSSTQNPNGDQNQIAKALGVKANQITVRVEQLGGGFGGKQNRAVLPGAMVAIAAKKMRRPILLKMSRETDMSFSGKRHPHISDYKASYQDDGTINAMHIELRADGGSTTDCSLAVMKGSVMMADGCYRTPTFRSAGVVYKTNKPSNTAMRTFGQVQPHLLLEDAIEHIAFDLSQRTGKKVRAEEIRRKNLYHSSQYETADATHFGQPLWYCDLREQWDIFYESAEFEKRMHAVDEFNANNRWRKRGISMIPLKYGIGFKQMPALNTSSALVHINKEDGSVVVAHGGVEMGQGLHTKIAQVAAHELNVPLSYIRIVRNNTDVIPNAPATAASTGFDLNGGAVAMACRTLKKRLQEVCDTVKKKKPELGDLSLQWREKWPTIVQHAWTQSVNLSASELYKAPHYDTPVDHYENGKFFAYFTYSFSISEVEIDVLTGEFSVIRTDLLYDSGKSSNPAIDIGQIEGGFVQGLGFVTTEETIYNEEGRLVTDNIWTYKPPCSKTIPLDLRVTLIPRDTAECFKQEQAGLLAVKATKSTSEPVLSLGNSVFFAIKNAIMAARFDQTGVEEWLELPAPLTCQRIQMACNVDSLKMTLKAPVESQPVGK
jgi:xanthine dehydrogenase/oxidase